MQVQSLDREDPLKKGSANPLQHSCLEKSHGQRILVGYGQWGRQRVWHDLATKQQQCNKTCVG